MSADLRILIPTYVCRVKYLSTLDRLSRSSVLYLSDCVRVGEHLYTIYLFDENVYKLTNKQQIFIRIRIFMNTTKETESI